MNVLSLKRIVFILIFVTFLSIIVYANSYDFCSLIACNNNSDCLDTCDGSYWYYGDGECSLGCYFNCSKRCKYDNRVCADSDSSDNFPKIDCCVRTCNAECDQDSDCMCPEDECLVQDYYDYPEQGVCNENCKCDCEPDIIVNDTRCIECEDNDGDSYYNYTISCPEGNDCDDSNPNINPSANESCFDGIDNDCDITIDLNDTDCYGCKDDDGDGYYIYSINCTEGDDCDDSNPNINPDATEVCNDGIDNNCDNKIDCDDSSCVSDAACVTPSPPPSGGGIITGGGPLFGSGTTIKKAVCGNDVCEAGEKCLTCPEDCLKEGEICCYNISYSGNCCVDADCGEGYECNITKYCNPLYVEEGEEPEPEICEEDWECTEWSECEDDIQLRGCIDINGCGTTVNMPTEFRKCEAPPVPITGLFMFETPADLVIVMILIFLMILIFFLATRTRR